MKIFAVCKTLRGEEFAEASLLSIYHHISGILYVHEDTGWMGRTGNSVREVIKTIPDPDKKVFHIDLKGKVMQDDQYNMAIDWIKENKIDYDYLQLIDCDEVWEEKYWDMVEVELYRSLRSKQPENCFKCSQFEYIKSPFYRVNPISGNKPSCFVHRTGIKKDVLAVRGLHIKGKILNEVVYHHFTLVRKTLTESIEKQLDSCGVENIPMVDPVIWIDHVWNKLPNATNVCPLDCMKDYWPAVKEIKLKDLPELIHEHPLVKSWMEYPKKSYGYYLRLNFKGDVFKKYGLPTDFGPNHPDWKIPSKRGKFEKAILEMKI